MNSVSVGVLSGSSGVLCGGSLSLVSYFGLQACGFDAAVPIAKSLGIAFSTASSLTLMFFALRQPDAFRDLSLNNRTLTDAEHAKTLPYVVGWSLPQIAGVGGALAL